MARKRPKYIGQEHIDRIERLKGEDRHISLPELQERFATSYDVWYNMTDDRPRGSRRYEPMLPSLRMGETKLVKVSDLTRLLNLTCNLPEAAREDFDIADLVARTCVKESPEGTPPEERVEPIHWYSPDDLSEIIERAYSPGYITILIGQGCIGAVKIGPRLWRIPEPEAKRVREGKLRPKIKIQRMPSLHAPTGRKPPPRARPSRPRAGRKP